MNKELFFGLLRESLLSERTEEDNQAAAISCNLDRMKKAKDSNTEFTANEWRAVYNELKTQAIMSLPLKWLQKHSFPDEELYCEWVNGCYKQQTHWIRLMGEQARLLALLEKHHIPCVIIKGSAAGMAYPEPHLRAAGDVDFLVRRCDYNTAAVILENKGFILEHEKNQKLHHFEYSKNGICFELHCRLGSVQESDDLLISLFEEGIMNRRIEKIGNFQFPVLPPELNGLSLMFHINHHLRKGLGLRQIIDWMMYIEKLPEEIWLNQELPMLRRSGMEKLALSVTAMCQKFLGLRTIVPEIDKYPCDELMDYILEKGNFGRKAGRNDKVATVALTMASPFRVIRRLQIGGLYRWESAKKYAILRPFAWVYQIGFIIGELVRLHMAPRQLWDQIGHGHRYRDLILSLGLKLDSSIEVKNDNSLCMHK